MATAAPPLDVGVREGSTQLARQWRTLTRAATLVAILTSPGAFLFLKNALGWDWRWALVGTIVGAATFRGFVDVVLRRFIPWPSLFGTDERRLRDEDVLARRRAWFWRRWVRWGVLALGAITIAYLVGAMVSGFDNTSWVDTATSFFSGALGLLSNPTFWTYMIFLPALLLMNFLILFGPLLVMAVSQIQSFEPGDAQWGVKLDDVRGQAEVKEEVRRVVALWQSGEQFEAAGGKRERGLLFLGAPGTGKTMLSKAIATGFNCFAPSQEFLTKEGLRSFADAVGTKQLVLNGNGEWVEAEVRSFGVQKLVSIELRPGVHTRSNVRQVIHATPDHRWITENRGTVTDLKAGDLVPFQPPRALDRVRGAFIRGFGYGDGTLDSRGRARIRLCGEKDRAYLPLFEAEGRCFVSYPPSYAGDPLVVFNGGHMSDWKALPSGDEQPDWLASWVDGYLAADGWTDASGGVTLETQDADAIDFVARVAPYAGYMVVGKSVKAASVATNYGARTAPLIALKLRREGVWRVVNVKRLPVASEVFCVVEPRTGTFTLAGGVLTGNCPFVSIPGSGFAQTFIGMDAVTVRWLAWKAKRLARKWGGQCIVFIDEIDAVGMRRQALGHPGGGTGMGPQRFEEVAFYGPRGALTASGDLFLETRAWRDRLFAERESSPRAVAPPFVQRIGGIVNQALPGMFGGGQLALNQLLVVMDGIGNPRLMRKVTTRFVNTMLDAIYVVPQRIGRLRLRLNPPPPAPEQIYFIGACNVPIESLDPALTRAGRMGRHVWFRTPTKQDRLDIFDLYLGKVAHDRDLDQERRRDELARITMGYSPAMIEQVCSMALTYAHHNGREAFAWDDLVEAMATVESGTAQNLEYVAEETRAVAIHEAGHAAAAHVHMPNVESSRISIRRRGASLGHHQAFEKEERFSKWRHEEIGALVWTLGAMAAERVFYGENSDGVGGDVQSATARAAFMVGASAMGPIPLDDETPKEARERIMKRFEEIGLQIMARTQGGGPMEANPVASVLGDRDKRAHAAQILGQAYLTAHHLMTHNKEKIQKVADELIARREIYGDELVELLDRQQLEAPKIDYEDEASWPRI